MLSAFTDARRAPTRPVSLQDADFEAKFDEDTLFFDIFQSGRSIVMTGPPLLNLAPLMQDLRVSVSGAAYPSTTIGLDKTVRVRAAVSNRAVRLVSGLGTVDCVVSPSGEDVFAGRRVLFTLSKDNKLRWIQDWIRYHRDNHGADAVLLYDNGSTAYDLNALAQAISVVGGLKASAVVAWPFKYGPLGGGDRPWDSDFCQSGMLEHARWRFLTRARSVLNCDIDELIVGPGSIFSAAESSLLGAVTCAGRWLYGVRGGDFDPPPQESARHRDYYIAEKPKMRFGLIPKHPSACRRKWAVVPARCPDRAQWRTHRFSGWFARNAPSPFYSLRHLHPINTNWWYARSSVQSFDPDRHCIDAKFKACLDAVAWDA